MDHVPRPSAASSLGDELRHPGTKLLSNLHDGIQRSETFEEYPLRRGFSKEDLGGGKFQPEQSQQAAALVQNWFFFGLLEEVFQVSVPTTDFIVNTTEIGEQFLSTRLLGEYVGRWRERVSRCGEEERVEIAARLRQVFREIARFFQLYVIGISSAYPDDFSVYLYPLAVLLETFQLNTSAVFKDGAEHQVLPTKFSPQITQELVQRGWCPFTIANILLPSFSPSLLEYARLFGDHPPFILQDHGECELNGCAVRNVDTSTYNTKHKVRFCKGVRDCAIFIPDMAVVKAKLESGKIPVVTFSENTGLATLGSEDGPYVAISHVWADGMGSTAEQGVPVCVVKFLAEGATKAFNAINEPELDTVAFWIDSLCVPSQTNLRRKAIGLMAETYASAAIVLVVDASMYHLSESNSMHEQLFVLYVSPWVQRLWTLQEALLSRQLLFLISDGFIDFRYLFIDEMVALGLNEPVASTLLSWFAQMMLPTVVRMARAAGSSRWSLPSPSIDDVALHLSKRTSRKPEDEILAISGLFNLDAESYVPLDPDLRMAKFLNEHNGGKVPSDVIFLNGPKLPLQGFSWAPKSFMNSGMGFGMKGTLEGAFSVITNGGLLGQYFCLVLQNQWGVYRPPRNYRLQIDEHEYLVVVFNRSIDLDEVDVVPQYNILVLSKPVMEGEEMTAACGQVLESMELGEDGDKVLQVELTCYVHVFNEDRKEDWNNVPAANSATGSTRFVMLS